MLELSVVDFGATSDGQLCKHYRFSDENGLRFAATDYGATITHLYAPDRAGKYEDVVLGFDKAADYETDVHYIGGTIGRFANRIAGGKFRLNGEVIQLSQNEGSNHLHGGRRGFHRRLWACEAEVLGDHKGRLTFQYLSPDGEEGYPGALDCQVEMIISTQPTTEITINYVAIPDRSGPINLTHHEYWNLAGAVHSNDILGHSLELNASHYLPTGEGDLPTGEISPTQGTAYDFTQACRLSDRHEKFPAELADGFNHCFALDAPSLSKPAAVLKELESGRQLKVYSTQPGLQLYSAGFMADIKGKEGAAYHRFKGLCLEAQDFPDAVNQTNFPSVIYEAGQRYQHSTIYQFDTISS